MQYFQFWYEAICWFPIKDIIYPTFTSSPWHNDPSPASVAIVHPLLYPFIILTYHLFPINNWFRNLSTSVFSLVPLKLLSFLQLFLIFNLLLFLTWIKTIWPVELIYLAWVPNTIILCFICFFRIIEYYLRFHLSIFGSLFNSLHIYCSFN